MAVYTPITIEEARDWLSHFQAGELVHLMPIVQGVENTNYLVHTTAARYILTLFEKRMNPQELPFFLALTGHLHRKGIPCPETLVARDGRMVVPLKGKPAILISFLEGKDTPVPGAHHCGELGALAARLHRATEDFSQSRPNALALGGWKTLAAKCAEGADNLIPGLWQTITDELHTLESHWPAALPKGVVHADLFPDNVFFKDGHISGVIDFYFACTESYAYDLAICLNAWCFEADGTFHPAHAQALLAAYQAIRPLEGAEIEALNPLLRGAALRFLLSRTHDMLFHPEGSLVNPKNPAEYLAKLRFHQQHPHAVTDRL